MPDCYDSVSEMSYTSSSSSSSTETKCSSPSRPRPTPLRLTHVGIDPACVIGKTLKRVSRSPNHPVLTLDFSDSTSFQILVDGYDPVHKGLPKELEMDPVLNNIFINGVEVDLTITDCALIRLSDKAFKQTLQQERLLDEWDQNHIGVAFKFDEPNPRWHCVWATLEDHAEGECIFRSYDDVYLNHLQRSPRKPKTHRRKNSSPIVGRCLW